MNLQPFFVSLRFSQGRTNEFKTLRVKHDFSNEHDIVHQVVSSWKCLPLLYLQGPQESESKSTMFSHGLNISCSDNAKRLARFAAGSFACSTMNCNVIVVATARPELVDLYAFNMLHIYALRLLNVSFFQVNKVVKSPHRSTRILPRVCEVRRTWNIIFPVVFLHAMFYEALSTRNTVTT